MPSPQEPFTRLFNGWRILFLEPFTTRWGDLSARVRRLRQTLPEVQLQRHPQFKLYAALFEVVYHLVPADPNARHFQLKDDLRAFRRVKGHGLPDRFRVFYTFSDEAKVIIFLYCNDERTLRNQGAGNDPYNIFRGLLHRREIGPDYATNFRRWRDQHSPDEGEDEDDNSNP